MTVTPIEASSGAINRAEESKEDLLRLVATLESGAKRIDESISRLQKVSRERGIERKCILKPRESIEKAPSVCQGQIKKTVRTWAAPLR
jgi:hypothetical protein